MGGRGCDSGVGRSEAGSIYTRQRAGVCTTWITPRDVSHHEYSLARSEDLQNQFGIFLRIWNKNVKDINKRRSINQGKQ